MVGDDGMLYVQLPGAIARVIPTTGASAVVVTVKANEGWGMNVGFGSAWVSRWDGARGWIQRYDLRTGALRAEIDVGEFPLESIAAFGSIWVPNHHSGTVSRINPKTNRVIATIPLRSPLSVPEMLTSGGGLIWTASPEPYYEVAGIDPATNKVVFDADVPGPPCGATWMLDRVWVGPCLRGQVWILDRSTGAVTGQLPLGEFPVTDGTCLWTTKSAPDNASFVLASVRRSALHRSDADRVTILGGPGGLLAAGALWVTRGSELLRFDVDALPRIPFCRA